ncbi:signal peptidase II [Clostridium botulinum C/D]|nr:signal peptidase II [Clostridium botulinum C/D]MCD3279850.1 signal peptidase II [Clostridium botulinum C/D]MCD3339581.1 signal peptidase II [Clostridium botulinum C/D]MCD3357489.1 signal peptidase II [Clostridium botulinum C/D]
MSKFFKTNFDENLTLDDDSIDVNRVWSSRKTFKEIIDHRLTKLEELDDVDVTNKKDKQVLAYSETTGKFVAQDVESVGASGSNTLKQITKMGIKADEQNPRCIKLPISTTDFKVPRVNILKYKNDDKNKIAIENDFTNSEANDFLKDKFIEFDGQAHLKTEYEQKWEIAEETENGIEATIDIDLDLFKSIEGFHDDIEDGVVKKLGITATPFDRILTPVGDMNLSNVDYINGFELKATGKNIKIVVSADSGKTWKTFSSEKWNDINLTVDDLKCKGMTIEFFNKINPLFWNELITKDKVRFAYLLSMDNIQDKEELDTLNLKYDGQGKWIQVKDSEFDVVYASNTILEVYVRFNGDIKINY